MKVFATSLSRFQKIALLAATILVAVVAYLLSYQFLPDLLDATKFRRWIDSFGVFAPIAFILVQIAQVVLAPIPGQFMAFLGGYIFGPVGGTLYSMIGVTIGSGIAFYIAKRYGRPFVEQVLHEDVIDRLDAFVEKAGTPGLFAFFVLPSLPDDAACFLAGLTPITLWKFLVVVVVGRLPAYILTNFAGGSLAEGRILEAAVIIGIFGLVSILAYYFRDELKRRLESL